MGALLYAFPYTLHVYSYYMLQLCHGAMLHELIRGKSETSDTGCHAMVGEILKHCRAQASVTHTVLHCYDMTEAAAHLIKYLCIYRTEETHIIVSHRDTLRLFYCLNDIIAYMAYGKHRHIVSFTQAAALAYRQF